MSSPVIAIVVTFNRLSLLPGCLERLAGLQPQPQAIILVDNASTDGTGEWVRKSGWESKPGNHFHPLDENLGGAGGFAEGIAFAQKFDARWLWLLDDDAYVEPDSLNRLLCAPAINEPTVGVLASKIVEPNGRLCPMNRQCRLDPTGRFYPLTDGELAQVPIECDTTSFVGFLVRNSIVTQVGLPRPDFFIHCDDVEYSLRIRDAGYKVMVIPTSIIHHHIQPVAEEAVVSVNQLWKHYYSRRNSTYLLLRRLRAHHRLRFLAAIFYHLIRASVAALYLPEPGFRITIEWRAFADGLLGRLGKRVQPGYLPKAKAQTP